MMETMKVSVTTPIATPSMVSDERSLFALTVARAIAADSLMSSKDMLTSKARPSPAALSLRNHPLEVQNPLARYSARSASMGSRLEAFQAGQSPLAMPTNEETPTPRTADHALKRSGKPLAFASRKASAKP